MLGFRIKQTPSRALTVMVNGNPVEVFEGESVHAALLCAQQQRLRKTHKLGDSRGAFCGMGVCYECLVTIDGVPNVRACMTEVADGMQIEVAA